MTEDEIRRIVRDELKAHEKRRGLIGTHSHNLGLSVSSSWGGTGGISVPGCGTDCAVVNGPCGRSSCPWGQIA